MIEETAVVTACDGEFAQVRAERHSACGGCSASGVCGTAALAKLVGQRHFLLRVLNPLGVHPGERVVIGLQEAALARASIAAYLVPILAMILFAILGQELAVRLNFTATEPASILGGLLGLSGGLYWLREFANRISHDKRYQSMILRRADMVSVSVSSDSLLQNVDSTCKRNSV